MLCVCVDVIVASIEAGEVVQAAACGVHGGNLGIRIAASPADGIVCPWRPQFHQHVVDAAFLGIKQAVLIRIVPDHVANAEAGGDHHGVIFDFAIATGSG